MKFSSYCAFLGMTMFAHVGHASNPSGKSECGPDNVKGCYRTLRDSVSSTAAQSSTYQDYYRNYRGPTYSGYYTGNLGVYGGGYWGGGGGYYSTYSNPWSPTYRNSPTMGAMGREVFDSLKCDFVDRAGLGAQLQNHVSTMDVAGCGAVCIGNVKCSGTLNGRMNKVRFTFYSENVACIKLPYYGACPSAKECMGSNVFESIPVADIFSGTDQDGVHQSITPKQIAPVQEAR